MKTVKEYINESLIDKAKSLACKIANKIIGTSDEKYDDDTIHFEDDDTKISDTVSPAVISGVIKVIFGIAGVEFMMLPTITAAFIAVVCFIIAFGCNLTPIIKEINDKIDNIGIEENKEEINEGLLSSIKKYISRIVVNNKYASQVANEIINTDEYKNLKDGYSLKDLVKVVTNYIKSNGNQKKINELS